MSQATNTTAEIGQSIGNILNPILGGTMETTVTEKPSASSTITTAILIIVVVVVIGIIGFTIFKKRAS